MANEVMNRFGLDPFFDGLASHIMSPMNNWVDRDLKTDIKETDKQYLLKVDIPGVDKKDIHLGYQDGNLMLNVDQQDAKEQKDESGKVIASERSHGVMSRTYELPDVDREHITARLDNGVLEIVVPKATTSESNGSHIEIQ